MGRRQVMVRRAFQSVVPGGGSGAATAFGFGFPAFGKPEGSVCGAGLTNRKPVRQNVFACGERRVTSGRALHRYFVFALLVPARRKFVAWDCKVTPADCACQERNTTGCISNNDGADTGMGARFSTFGRGKSLGFQSSLRDGSDLLLAIRPRSD